MKPIFKTTSIKSATLPVRFCGLCLSLALLSGCSAFSRLDSLGEAPKFATIENPTLAPDYKPVNMPMPLPQVAKVQHNSLWRAGAQTFFENNRAADVGDLVTVVIKINDKATITNNTARTRANSDDVGFSSILGYGPATVAGLLPDVLDIFPAELADKAAATNLLETDSALSNAGTGAITRSDVIKALA